MSGNITAPIDDVRETRARLGCSLKEAEMIVLKEVMLTRLEEAATLDDLKPIIRRIVSRMSIYR